jgi:hypothetical protein
MSVAEQIQEQSTDAMQRLLARWTCRSPEQKEADRIQARKSVRPARTLPPDKTLEDIVVGKWPGKETDQQVTEALDNLS